MLKFSINTICFGVSYIPPSSSLNLYSSHIDNINIYWSNSLDQDLIPTNINKHFEMYVIDSLLEIDLIQSTFRNICLNIIPLKNQHSFKHPWYTKGLKRSKNQCNKLHNKFQSSGCSIVYEQYRIRQKEFNFLNKFLYKQYILNIENNIKCNPKSF